FVTGDVLRVDSGGDFWFVGRHDDILRTAGGAFPAQRIEDALYTAGGLALCCVVGIAEAGHDVPAAIVVPLPGAALDLDALRNAALLLPAHARPRHYVRADVIPLTDGYRPIKTGLRALVQEGP